MSLVHPYAYIRDYTLFAPRFLKVKHREGGRVIPFNAKPAQLRLREKIASCERRGRPARIAIFKARRGGMSTETGGKFFHRCITRPYQRALMVAHKGPDARTIFEIYERFYEHLPPEVRPYRSGSRGQMLDFRKLGSQIEVISAESEQAGRGGDAQLCHLSEAAFYNNPEEFLSGLLRQVPSTGDSVVILESTANGPGTWWHDLYTKSVNGEGGWDWMFSGWYEDPENRLPEPIPMDDWTEEEIDLHERFGVDGYQIAWRRYTIDTEMFGDENRFRRENPATAEEGFIRIGDPAWSSEILSQCYQRMEPKFFARVTEFGVEKTGIKDPLGQLVVWEEPIADHDYEYVIGADVGGGLSTSDLSVASVWRVSRKPGKWPAQVAEWAGKIDGVTFAQTLTAIGHYYKKALIACEVTGLGRICQHALQKTYYYPRLYRWTRFDAYKATGDTWGWETTWKSKEIMHGLSDWCFRTKRVTMRSPWLMHELINYQNVGGVGPDSEHYKGLSGDDRIMAGMIGLVAWFKTAYSGIPLKELRTTLAKMYGGTSEIETATVRATDAEPLIVIPEPEIERPKWRPRNRVASTDEGW